MSCIQIRLVDRPSHVGQRHESQDGFLYLDMPDDFDYRQVRRVTELSDIYKLKFDFTIEVDIIPTPRNYAILKNYSNPNVLDPSHLLPVPVHLVSGSHVLEDNDLYVTKCTKKQITVKIRLGLNHWGRKSQSVKLCELDLGEFTFSCDNILQVVENDYLYQDGNAGIWFPAAVYGTPRSEFDYSPLGVIDINSVRYIFPREFLRPWFHATFMLQKLFCELGYEFCSPLFDSDLGRTIGHYMIDKAFGTSQISEETVPPFPDPIETNRVRSLDASARLLGDTMPYVYLNGTASYVPFYVIDNDPGSHISQPLTGAYYSIPPGGESGLVDVNGQVSFQVKQDNTVDQILNNTFISEVIVKIGYLIEGNDTTFRVRSLKEETFQLTGEEDAVYNFSFDFEDVPIVEGDIFGVWFIAKNRDRFDRVNFSGEIDYTGKRIFPRSDEVVELSSMIDCELTGIDYLKELARVLNLKIATNPVTRKVTLYPPYLADWWGTTVEGFYIEEDIEDIAALINPKSKDVETPDLGQPRWRLLGYADHENEAINRLGLANELWSKRVDMGSQFAEEELDLRAELLEPVYNFPLLHVPWFRSTEDGHEHTFDIGPNIIFFHGDVAQEIDGKTPKETRICGRRSLRTPVASMFVPPNIRLSQNGTVAPRTIIEQNLVYEANRELLNPGRRTSRTFAPGVNTEVVVESPEKNLYTLVYRRWLAEELTGLKIEYLVDYSKLDFLSEDFRKFKCFMHQGRPIRVRLTEMRDFRHCKDGQTPMKFIPQLASADQKDVLQEVIGTVNSNCQNQPVIVWTRDETTGCYTFTIGGTNNGAILGVSFIYTTATSSIPQIIPNTSPITAELCLNNEIITVTAVVQYEDPCNPKTTPPVYLDTCSGTGFTLNIKEEYTFGPFTYYLCPELLQEDPTVPVTIVSASYEEFHFTVLTPEGDLTGGISQGVNIYDPNTTRCLEDSLWDTGGDYYKVRFEWTIETYPGCPPITLTALYEPLYAENRSLDCSDTNAYLTYTKPTPTTVTFNIEGVVTGGPDLSDSVIRYRVSNDGGVTWTIWSDWDGTPVAGGLIEARLIIEWDSDLCPHYFFNIAIDINDCDCSEIALMDVQIDCTPEGLMTYTVNTGGAVCTLPPLQAVSWLKGDFQSGVATEIVGNAGTHQITEEGDYKVIIIFENGCILESPVIDIPFAGDTTNIAGK